MDDGELVDGEEANLSEPGLKPWYKFWANRWMSSPTVNGMTLNQQAIFVRVLCGIHMYGKLPRDPWQLHKLIGTPYKATALWMQSYFHLTVDVQSNRSESEAEGKSKRTQFTVPKMEELQVLSKKSSADRAGDEKRSDQRRSYLSSAPDGAGEKKQPPGPKRLPPDPNCSECHGEGVIDIPAHPGRAEMAWNTIAQDCECTMARQGSRGGRGGVDGEP
jgi:hypothetical protein